MSETDQTPEIMKELMQAERQQEITQATTIQGQIVALVLVLRDAGVLQNTHIDLWEARSEQVTSLLTKMAQANEVRQSDSEEEPEQQLATIIEGASATIEFAGMMGNSEEVLQPLREHRDDLVAALKDMKNGA